MHLFTILLQAAPVVPDYHVELRVLAICASVFAIMQALKLAPWFAQYMSGWVAVAVNVALSVLGVFVAIPKDALFTLNTITTVVIAAIGAAGIHGTYTHAIRDRNVIAAHTATDPSKFPHRETKMLAMLLALVLPVFFMAGLSGCASRTHITNVPPGVNSSEVEAWYTAAGALSVVADSTKGITSVSISLQHNGQFPNQTAYNNLLSTMARVSQAGIHARNLLYQQPDHFPEPVRDQLVAFAQESAVELNKMNQEGLTGITDPNAQQNISNLMREVNSALNVLMGLKGFPTPASNQQAPSPAVHPMRWSPDNWSPRTRRAILVAAESNLSPVPAF